MYFLSLCCLTIIVSCLTVSSMTLLQQDSYRDYQIRRTHILEKEMREFLGSDIVLTEAETKANDFIVKVKGEELELGYKNETAFLPSQNFMEVKEKIESSGIFSLLKKLPKGASLHTHMLAAVNVDFIVTNITYRDQLYGGFINGVFKLHFFEDGHEDNRSQWRKISEMRQEDENFDDWLRKQFLMLINDHKDVNDVWNDFKRIFNTVYEMFSFRPVFEDMLYQLLEELHLDNVMYTELKGTFMPLYELDGTIHGPREFLEIFDETVKRFEKEHEGFVGARYIHSVYRGIADDKLEEELKKLLEMKQLYPDLIAGFDFVGYEEEGNTLYHYSEALFPLKDKLNFYFHAGETNWYGHTDLNLADAILLGSKRIGHGYALTKHPSLRELAKEKDIAVELCPVSNQVLKLHEDPRSHPVVELLAKGYPVVVCNDDPSIWNASGLSYDWYVAFMAMTPKDSGLTVLKKLALNSLSYSALEDSERTKALAVWESKWQDFIGYVNNMAKN